MLQGFKIAFENSRTSLLMRSTARMYRLIRLFTGYTWNRICFAASVHISYSAKAGHLLVQKKKQKKNKKKKKKKKTAREEGSKERGRD